MPDTSYRLGLPFILPGQAQKHVTHNEALTLLDGLVHLVLEDIDMGIPPAAPQEGAVYALAAAPQGDWAGQGGQLAQWQSGGWRFIPPQDGWQGWLRADGSLRVYQAAVWATLDMNNLEGVGIGITADGVNRLAVASEATLLTHAGAGHQVKVNKAAVADTASVLFQTGWAGRAEIGTAGTDDFAIKVSADGSAWTTAVQIDTATGALGGAGVAQLMVGPVSQSGGTPTGAIIERGTNPDGEYVRFADGTQICACTLTNTAANAAAICTFPAAFVAAPVVTATALYAGGMRFAAIGTATATDVEIRTSDAAGNESVVPGARVQAFGRWF